jgi:23S rRNA-/tRNA-specific pseudouridylate synthase
VEECLSSILDKTVSVLDTKRGELIAVASKMLNRLYAHFDLNKIIKEYLKLLVGNSKTKVEIINQLITILRENEQK